MVCPQIIEDLARETICDRDLLDDTPFFRPSVCGCISTNPFLSIFKI
jgi:hypothetical protein